MRRRCARCRAIELLQFLSKACVPHAIATSGLRQSAARSLEMLDVDENLVIITRDMVRYAKPDPDLFLAAADQLGVSIHDSVVIGDSVWDLLAARRARAIGVGVLSGGYGQEELERAGAYRVYQDPADLLEHPDEVGLRVVRGLKLTASKAPVETLVVTHVERLPIEN